MKTDLANLDSLVGLGVEMIDLAQKAGADVAEACLQQSSHLSAKVRLQQPELVEEAGSRVLGLRVMIGQQVAVTCTSDLSESGRRRLVQDAIELARLSEPDPYAGPPRAELLSSPSQWKAMDLYDLSVGTVPAEDAIKRAIRAEQAAFDADKRITNSEGTTFGRASGVSALVTSGGFRAGLYGTSASLFVNPIADDIGGKKRSGYHWTASRFLQSLESEVNVGTEAARRTVRQLGSTKLKSQELPVVFERDAARSLLSLFAGCILGSAIWRKNSYLVDRVGTRVASEMVSLIDDPFLDRGPGSRPFDGEGLLSRTNLVVDRGVLRTFLTDAYSGRKLNLPSTANASRSSSGGVGPSTTNFVLQPGTMTSNELIEDTEYGFYVTHMMGFGFNSVTGDFSRGASGFVIRQGELAEPVSEVTISLNLDELFKRIDAVGNDVDYRSSIASPTVRVSSMTLAGS